MSAPVRIGLVGYGRGGRYFHAPLIVAAGCELAGVVTRSEQRSAELAKDYPGTPTYDTLGDLADAGVDAVVVSTPVDTHVDLVQQAIALRLPVVCDKPFALDAAVARDTVEAAERAGVLLSVYQNRRWDADFLTVAKLVSSDDLGEVVRFESRMEQYPPESGYSTTGGGVLRDFGSHLVDQALQLFGPVRSVYAEVNVRADLDSFDDQFFAALRHRSGPTSHLWGSWVLSGAPGPRFRVIGSTATYAVEPDDRQADLLLAGRSPATEGDMWALTPEEKWGRIYRHGAAEPVPTEPGRWESFYTGFAAAVRGEADVPVNPWDAVAALTVLDAARASGEQSAVIEVDTTNRGTTSTTAPLSTPQASARSAMTSNAASDN
jgi:predicted dehydrogenase